MKGVLPTLCKWSQRLGVSEPSSLPRLPAATGVPASAAGAAPAELRELFRGVLERHELFAGRERELDVLERAAAVVRGQVGAPRATAESADPTALGRYVCVSAPAGFGKSALLANWATGSTARQTLPRPSSTASPARAT